MKFAKFLRIFFFTEHLLWLLLFLVISAIAPTETEWKESEKGALYANNQVFF